MKTYKDFVINRRVNVKEYRARTGTIVSTVLYPNKRDAVVSVKWDDPKQTDSNQEIESVLCKELDLLPEIKSELEQRFQAVVDTIGQEIENKIEQANKLLEEACELSDQHGVPFYAKVSILGQPYVPNSFDGKWGKLDRHTVGQMMGMTPYDLEYGGGWKTSDVC